MKLGLVFSDLGNSQDSFMGISYANTLCQTNLIRDVTLFFCECVPPIIKPLVACINIDRVFQFDGTLVVTTLQMASLIAGCNANKILYLYDLEWLRGKGNYISNLNLLKNCGFRVIARSEEHAKVINNYANIEVEVIENFDLIKMLGLDNG